MTGQREPSSGGSDRIAVIAGAGRFPFIVAEGAKRAGCEVVVVGLRGLADPALGELADRFYWSGVVRLGQWIRILRRERVERAIMAGSVRKADMFRRFALWRYVPDWTSFRIWFYGVADRRNDTLLRAAADEMKRRGIELVNSVEYCPEHLAPEGTLTRSEPTPAQRREIEFGWPIAKSMGRLDVGQAIAVKDREVVAVEAIEGTDRLIERAGRLCPAGGWMLIKVAKPDQDMRFDVPTVGPGTIENLHEHGAGALVIEAGTTLVVHMERVLSLAERYGITIVGREDALNKSPTRPARADEACC